MYIDDLNFQLQVFLYSLGWGVLSGVLYDLFRFVRIAFIKSSRAVIGQDILYFVLLAVMTFLFLLVVNNGQLRAHIFFSFLIGFSVYYLTLSRFILAALLLFIKYFKKLFGAVSLLITTPFRFVLFLFGKIRLKSRINIRKYLKKKKISEKNS